MVIVSIHTTVALPFYTITFSSTETEVNWSLNKSRSFHSPSLCSSSQITASESHQEASGKHFSIATCVGRAVSVSAMSISLSFQILRETYLLTILIFLWITQGPFQKPNKRAAIERLQGSAVFTDIVCFLFGTNEIAELRICKYVHFEGFITSKPVCEYSDHSIYHC